MKTRILILTAILTVISLGAFAIKDGQALTGTSLTGFGKYTLVNADFPMVYDNVELKTYELNYENASSSVQIGVLKEKKCKTFIVRSDEFEVQYTCTNGVFGVKKIENRFAELPKEEMDSKLNRVAYFAQRVICHENKSEDDLLGLIACYFPNLINEQYQASF